MKVFLFFDLGFKINFSFFFFSKEINGKEEFMRWCKERRIEFEKKDFDTYWNLLYKAFGMKITKDAVQKFPEDRWKIFRENELPWVIEDNLKRWAGNEKLF
jgi:hypothetical protein